MWTAGNKAKEKHIFEVDYKRKREKKEYKHEVPLLIQFFLLLSLLFASLFVHSGQSNEAWTSEIIHKVFLIFFDSKAG